MNSNTSITQAAAKTMEHLTKFVFICTGNVTLAHRDAYVTHLKRGIKPDTRAALRTVPMHISTLFLGSIIKKARDTLLLHVVRAPTTPTKGLRKGPTRNLPTSQIEQHGRTSARVTIRNPKAVFLLALGLGKCRSKIHACQSKNIRHQSDWSRVSLYLSPSFLSKNQLAKQSPDSVTSVVIPALATTLDKSLRSNRSMSDQRFALLF